MLKLFDADVTSSGDDELFTVEGDRHPEVQFDYAEGIVKLRVLGDPTYRPLSWGLDRPITDAARFCTRAAQPHVCLMVSVTEVVP